MTEFLRRTPSAEEIRDYVLTMMAAASAGAEERLQVALAQIQTYVNDALGQERANYAAWITNQLDARRAEISHMNDLLARKPSYEEIRDFVDISVRNVDTAVSHKIEVARQFIHTNFQDKIESFEQSVSGVGRKIASVEASARHLSLEVQSLLSTSNVDMEQLKTLKADVSLLKRKSEHARSISTVEKELLDATGKRIAEQMSTWRAANGADKKLIRQLDEELKELRRTTDAAAQRWETDIDRRIDERVEQETASLRAMIAAQFAKELKAHHRSDTAISYDTASSVQTATRLPPRSSIEFGEFLSNTRANMNIQFECRRGDEPFQRAKAKILDVNLDGFAEVQLEDGRRTILPAAGVTYRDWRIATTVPLWSETESHSREEMKSTIRSELAKQLQERDHSRRDEKKKKKRRRRSPSTSSTTTSTSSSSSSSDETDSERDDLLDDERTWQTVKYGERRSAIIPTAHQFASPEMAPKIGMRAALDEFHRWLEKPRTTTGAVLDEWNFLTTSYECHLSSLIELGKLSMKHDEGGLLIAKITLTTQKAMRELLFASVRHKLRAVNAAAEVFEKLTKVYRKSEKSRRRKPKTYEEKDLVTLYSELAARRGGTSRWRSASGDHRRNQGRRRNTSQPSRFEARLRALEEQAPRPKPAAKPSPP